MTEKFPVIPANRIFVLLFVVALAAHGWWVTRNWTTPFLSGHEFRQTQTAINTYYIDRQDNFSLLYETPIVGKPWVSVLMEVPIYEWAVVGLSRGAGLPYHESARTITLACFYLTLPAFFLLLGLMHLEWSRRLLILALTLVCPVYIYYSRAFLMDSMALLGCAWFLFGYVRMMQARRWYWFLLATVAGTLAALVKSATLAVWLWPAAVYAGWQLWQAARTRAGWGGWGEAGLVVFWGVAGVIVPLGLLQLWIELTDPLKAMHASAWIFTSANLSLGNWGLVDFRARFTSQLWGVLAERWREAIMPAWLLLALLGAGLVFLPRVRWPALALAGIFFGAQFLFPYAYAYQDYYFYSCAVFATAGMGFLLAGLFDSRLPRWLCWLLLAVPFAAQAVTYVRGYYPSQLVQSTGGFSFTRAIRDFLPKEAVIVVAGDDWAAIVPYYAERKALMLRNGLENDALYLDRAFADLADEEVGALVLMDRQRGNHALIARVADAFGTDRQPSFSSDRAEVYCNLRYRKSVKEALANAGNYDGLVNPLSEPVVTPSPARPFRVWASTARESFPAVSPAPIRAYFEVGVGYVWVNHQKVLFAHPDAHLWIPPPRRSTRITWEFGIIPEAYEHKEGMTDGVEFTVMAIKPQGEREVVFRRVLDPVNRAADRGLQREVIPHQPVPGEILHFSTAPGEGRAFDWAYWARIEVR
jgi:hypothetical protein